METISLGSILQDLSQLIEKRHRNLTKRKSKLDQYRSNLSKGITLNDDQKKSIEKYDSVLASISTLAEVIETTNDFHKRMTTAISSFEKQKEKAMKHNLQMSFCDWIVIENFLKSIDNPNVREAIVIEFSEPQYEILKCISNHLLDSNVPSLPCFNQSEERHEYYEKNSSLSAQSSNILKLIDGVPKTIGLKGSKTQITYQDARKMIFDMMENTYVQHALMGKPYVPISYVEPVKQQTTPSSIDSSVIIPAEPIHVEETEPQFSVSSELYDKIITPVNSSYNFIHASRVSTNTTSGGGGGSNYWSGNPQILPESNEVPAKPVEEPPVNYSDEKENAPAEDVQFSEKDVVDEEKDVEQLSSVKQNTWATIIKNSDKNRNVILDPTGDSRMKVKKTSDEKPRVFNHNNQNIRSNFDKPNNGFRPRGGAYSGRGGRGNGGFRGNRNGPRMNNYPRQNGGPPLVNRQEGHVSEVYQ